jgi:hypothetical protein
MDVRQARIVSMKNMLAGMACTFKANHTGYSPVNLGIFAP